MNPQNGIDTREKPTQLKIQVNGHNYSNSQKRLKKQTSKEGLSDACLDGITGSFSPVKNDFSPFHLDLSGQDEPKHFQNEPHWTREECEKVRKFRFIVATLGLIGLLLCLTSRMVLNVGIVEMSKPDPVEDMIEITTTTEPFTTMSGITEEFQMDTTTEYITEAIPSTTLREHELVTDSSDYSNDLKSETPANQQQLPVTVSEDVELLSNKPYKIEWTSKRKNYLIASFYMGYAPSMMFTGGLANKYGSFVPLFVGVFMSFLINAVTPLITSYSYSLLFISRLLLGVCQGSVMPSLYDVFNRWLTATETSIFAPMIKVSFGIGSLLGSALPALTKQLGYDWPYLFYETSIMCGIWSIAWFFLATSSPQENRFVEPSELQRIMRKKIRQASAKRESKAINQLSIISANSYKLEDLKKLEEEKKQTKSEESNESPPFLLIALNRSVLGLALTKFTYNIGADFICLELPIYLDRIHEAPIEAISQITSAGFLIQAIFSVGVGWLAKYAVQKNLFGLSKSRWRKAFQGFSNFGMSICYFILAFCKPSFTLIIVLLEIVFFLWIFGAGGESIVAYDMSPKYPATITGFAHSIGITSSFMLPAICDFILQGQEMDNKRWETVFLLIGVLTFVGGLVFVFVVRPKPFLPGEIEERKQSVR